MGKIIETHVDVAIVTMVTVKVSGETNMRRCMDVEKRSNLALMGLRSRDN